MSLIASASITGGGLFYLGTTASVFLLALLLQLGFGFTAFQAGLIEAPCPPELFDDVDRLYWGWAERFELDLARVPAAQVACAHGKLRVKSAEPTPCQRAAGPDARP